MLDLDLFETEYCCGSEATLPAGIRISNARFTGNPIAECDLCGDFRCAYWECPCELVHDCQEEN